MSSTKRYTNQHRTNPPKLPTIYSLEESFVQVSSSITVKKQQFLDEEAAAASSTKRQQQQQQQQQVVVGSFDETNNGGPTTTGGKTNTTNNPNGKDDDADDDERDATELKECINFLSNHQIYPSLVNDPRFSDHHKSTVPSFLPERIKPESAKRIQRALEADIERLQLECLIYDNAISSNQSNQKVWNQAIDRIVYYATNNKGTMSTSDDIVISGDIDNITTPDFTTNTSKSNANNNIKNVEQVFRNEIETLEKACRECEHELSVLYSLQNEQKVIKVSIEQAFDELAEEHNNLEIAARAFDNDQQQLYRTLSALQDELDRVSSSAIKLPATLYQLQVDHQRGLRYPLINDLRLAYRPKGDVRWDEIQGAWSLAAQLLLSVGTLFDFQTNHFKIVPLSRYAKIIYYPPVSITTDNKQQQQQQSQQVSTEPKRPRDIVYNLGHPNTNAKHALLTWNALMCQIINYVQSTMKDDSINGILDVKIPPVPIEITSTSIGNISLTKLDENDDSGWSRVIHYMASNLLWLSDCASVHVLNEVVLAA